MRADGDVLAAIDGVIRRAAEAAGSNLACRPGCSECCIGPFPITRLDAWRLRQGLADLRGRDRLERHDGDASETVVAYAVIEKR